VRFSPGLQGADKSPLPLWQARGSGGDSMNAHGKTELAQMRIYSGCGILVSFEDAQTLRRAAEALRRWFKRECKDGMPAIARGAVRRVQDVCARYGLEYRINTDPRSSVLRIYSPALLRAYPYCVSIEVLSVRRARLVLARELQ
jgi:hypothetical protein